MLGECITTPGRGWRDEYNVLSKHSTVECSSQSSCHVLGRWKIMQRLFCLRTLCRQSVFSLPSLSHCRQNVFSLPTARLTVARTSFPYLARLTLFISLSLGVERGGDMRQQDGSYGEWPGGLLLPAGGNGPMDGRSHREDSGPAGCPGFC